MQPHDARILIVDDAPDIREIFVCWLEHSGYTNVRTAEDGVAALAAIQAEPIDILISDVQMPHMDGVTLVRRLYEMRIKVSSIILMSGFNDVEICRLYDMGVEAFLPKPLDCSELLGYIERAATDRSRLWVNPMAPAPRQTIDIEVENLAHHSNGTDSGETLYLGRGGFSARADQPLRLGKVAFSCALPATSLGGPRRVLAGHGNVRWRSSADETVGVEFSYLDPACRNWVVDMIAGGDYHSFIPAP